MAQYQRIPLEDPFDSKPEKIDSKNPKIRRRSSWCSCFSIVISVLLNMILLAYTIIPSSLVGSSIELAPSNLETTSLFAGLSRDIPRQWTLNSFTNEAEWADIWENQTSYDAGVVALDDEYARARGLPRAQRWPWDPNKGIYLINGYHNLHCVKSLQVALEEFKTGREQSNPWGHVQHCLLVLRDEVLCNADDTPRYSGFQPNRNTAYGQWRMCRDWSALERWAQDKERSGCWRHIPGEKAVNGFKEIDRYRFCPQDSKYKEISQMM